MDDIFCCLIFFDFSILHRFFIGCDIFLLFEMSILDRISLSSRAVLLVVHIVLWFCNVFLFFLSIKLYHLLWEGVRVFLGRIAFLEMYFLMSCQWWWFPYLRRWYSVLWRNNFYFVYFCLPLIPFVYI